MYKPLYLYLYNFSFTNSVLYSNQPKKILIPSKISIFFLCCIVIIGVYYSRRSKKICMQRREIFSLRLSIFQKEEVKCSLCGCVSRTHITLHACFIFTQTLSYNTQCGDSSITCIHISVLCSCIKFIPFLMCNSKDKIITENFHKMAWNWGH